MAHQELVRDDVVAQQASEARETCAEFIPAQMRGGSAYPEPTDDRRPGYLHQRRMLRLTAVICGVPLLIAWAVALSFTVNGADSNNAGGALAIGGTLFIPIVLVLLWGGYAWLRRRWRIDEYEEHRESSVADRYPADRLVTPGGRVMTLLVMLPIALLLASFVWAPLGTDGVISTIDLAVGGLLSLAILALVCATVVRVGRLGIRESKDGVLVTTLFRSPKVCWDEVRQLRLELLEVSVRGGTSRTLRVSAIGDGAAPSRFTWNLMLGSPGQRARSRHNIRVAARWSQEHGLAPDVGLDAALRWADGQLAQDELEAAAHLVER